MSKKISDFLNNYFRVEKHDSTIKKEVIAGVTNYFTVIYLVFLVPEIIMEAFPGVVSAGGEFSGDVLVSGGITSNEMLILLTAAAFIAAGIGTLLMGVFINVPFAQGPSLSIGTFVTYTICRNFGYTFNQALAIVFISGICFFIISVLGLEKKIHKAIPNNIKFAVTAGIGLFIAYTGLEKAHIVSFGNDTAMSLFNVADLSSSYTKDALLALFGIIFITVLLKKGFHGAIFWGKILCIVLAFPLGLIKAIDVQRFEYSLDLSKTFMQLDFSGLIDLDTFKTGLFSITTVVILVFSICIMNVFETMSTLIATKNYIKISSDGQVKKRIPQILEIDAVTSSVGSLIGSTTVSTYVESTAGVIEGGRTGLTAVVTGLLFLASVFFSPIVSIIPSSATATTLIMAGVIMLNVIKYIDFEDVAEAVPAFFTMFIIPVTKSLIVGIAFGIISYLIIYMCLGRREKIKPILYALALLFTATLIVLPK